MHLISCGGMYVPLQYLKLSKATLIIFEDISEMCRPSSATCRRCSQLEGSPDTASNCHVAGHRYAVWAMRPWEWSCSNAWRSLHPDWVNASGIPSCCTSFHHRPFLNGLSSAQTSCSKYPGSTWPAGTQTSRCSSSRRPWKLLRVT